MKFSFTRLFVFQSFFFFFGLPMNAEEPGLLRSLLIPSFTLYPIFSRAALTFFELSLLAI